MPISVGNSPLQNTPIPTTTTHGATSTGRLAEQAPAQEKRGFLSIFQKSKLPVEITPKPITNRTIFSSFANIKMLVANRSFSATTQTLRKEQCIKELGSLKDQRAGLIKNKGGEQEIKKLDDAIGERSKSISAKDWMKIFGTDSGLLMSMPKNAPVRQDFVVFNMNYHTSETIMFLEAASDPANLTREGMSQLFNKFICAGAPQVANVAAELVNKATSQLHAMDTRGDTSATNFKAVLAPIVKEMENVVNKDPLTAFGKKLDGAYKMTEAFTPAQAHKEFDSLTAQQPDKDLLTPQLQKLETIRLREDPKVAENLFEGNTQLKTASKDSLFGDNATVDIKGLDDAAPKPTANAPSFGNADLVASHPILSQMGKAMAQSMSPALSGEPGKLLVAFAKTLAATTVSESVPRSLAELTSGSTRGQWENYVDTLGANKDAGNALSNIRGELLNAKNFMIHQNNPVVGGALDGMIAIIEKRLSGAPAAPAVPSSLPANSGAAARVQVPVGQDPLSQIRDRQQLISSLPTLAHDELRAHANAARDQMQNTRPSSAGYKDAAELLLHVNNAVSGQVGKLASVWVQHFERVNNGEKPKTLDFIRLPNDHPARIAFDFSLAGMGRSSQSEFLAQFEGVDAITLAQARNIAEKFLVTNDINQESLVIKGALEKLGGTLTSVPVNGSALNYKDTVVWGDQKPEHAALEPLTVFDENRGIAKRLGDQNLADALKTQFFKAP